MNIALELLRWTTFVVMVINFASFAWSVVGVFRKVEDQNQVAYGVLRLASMVTWVIALATFRYRDEVEPLALALGLVMQISVCILYYSARQAIKSRPFTIVFSNDTPEFVQTSGPYSLVRHPFYGAYVSSYVAAAIANQSALTAGAACVMLAIYLFAAHTEESKFIASPVRDVYMDYMKRTGRFLPRVATLVSRIRRAA